MEEEIKNENTEKAQETQVVAEVKYEDLGYDKGLFTKDDKPFTGTSIRNHSNGKIGARYQFVDGIFDGIIEEWYENHTLIPTSKKDTCKYEKGMMISISNNKCTYETLYPTFKEVYISIIKALKGKDHSISKWDVRTLKGYWEKKNGDRVVLPSREELLRVIVNQTPIMLAGIHNYKKDDIRINPYDQAPLHRKLIDKKNKKVGIFDLGNHILIIGMILIAIFISLNVG